MSAAGQGFLTDGQTIVREAESKLRVLVARAAEDGDYDAVITITDWAKRMRCIIDGPISGLIRGKEEQPESRKSAAYPKFYKSDDELIMIGLSNDNTEYEHRAPKDVLDKLVPILVGSTQDGKPVPIKVKEGLLPRLKADNGSEYPEYSVRTFLRWLKNIELVSKHGHTGYSIKNPENFENLVYKNWKELTDKQN